MDRRAWFFLVAALSCLFSTTAGWTQTTYEDPQGRFVIDLPKGWKYDPMIGVLANEKTADFQDEGRVNAFTLAISRGFDDPDKLIKQAALQFKFLEPVFDGEVLAMSVNGHPARWGILKTPLDPGMIMQVASIVLENNGIYLIHDAADDFSALSIVHIPTGRRNETILSPHYLSYGLWQVVDFDKGIVYHSNIGMDPTRYELSEARAYYPYKKAKTVNTFLIAQPVKVPR